MNRDAPWRTHLWHVMACHSGLTLRIRYAVGLSPELGDPLDERLPQDVELAGVTRQSVRRRPALAHRPETRTVNHDVKRVEVVRLGGVVPAVRDADRTSLR